MPVVKLLQAAARRVLVVNRLAGRLVYAIDIVTTAENLQVAGEAGVLTFLAHRRLQDVTHEYNSALLVCGLTSRHTRDLALFAWLKHARNRMRRLGAVCVGAFLLPEAGLLCGRRVTAHWRFGSELAKRYTRIKLVPPQLWVKDGNIYTSAGISAGIDLALAWVEEDCGSTTAHEVARELVLFLRRPGGQPQLSISLAAEASKMRALQELQLWIAVNLQKRLSVEELAGHAAAVSPRSASRRRTTSCTCALKPRVVNSSRPTRDSNRSPPPLASAARTPCAAPSSAISASLRRTIARNDWRALAARVSPRHRGS